MQCSISQSSLTSHHTTSENSTMASSVMKRAGSSAIQSVSAALRIRSYAKIASGTDIVSAAPNVSLQKARTWDEGVDSKFSTTPIKDIFKDKKVVIFGLPGAYPGVCSSKHVPPYKRAENSSCRTSQETEAAKPVQQLLDENREG